jgi:hypothetical protein
MTDIMSSFSYFTDDLEAVAIMISAREHLHRTDASPPQIRYRPPYPHDRQQDCVGSFATMAQGTLIRGGLIGAPLIIVLSAVANRRIRAGSDRWHIALTLICGGIVCCCSRWLFGGMTNDGADPHVLGIVHDARVPGWVHFADVAVPLTVVGAAALSLLLLLLLIKPQR